jgi:DNA-binding GntR family transcriptional regulator
MPRPRKPRVDLDPVSILNGADRRQLWEGVADALREAILAGSLPAGASLVEADLADRFDVSRGPIRDALRSLAQEGLVLELPRRGTVVSTLSFADIQEVYEVREGLEIAGVRLAVVRAPDGAFDALSSLLSDLEAAWRQGADYTESLALDLRFHEAVVALSGNGRLMAAYDQMLAQTRLQAISAASLNPRLGRGMKRAAHRDIAGALKRRDADAAAAAVAAHYGYARERLLTGIRRPG